MVRFLRPGDTGLETAEKMVVELNKIDGIFDADISKKGADIIIEWRMPDPDFLYPSSVNIADNNSKIMEATIRLGPLGNREVVGRRELDRIKGNWVDVALTAAQEVGLLEHMGRESVDIGDGYVSSKIRPHVRFHRKEEGYDMRHKDFVDFIDELSQRFDANYGTLEDRMVDQKFADRFRE